MFVKLMGKGKCLRISGSGKSTYFESHKSGEVDPLVSLGVGPSQRSARSRSRPEDLEEPVSAFPERREEDEL